MSKLRSRLRSRMPERERQGWEMARALTNRCCGGTTRDADGVLGAALMGVAEALRTFDETRGASWTTYLYNCIWWAISRELRNQDHLNGHVRQEWNKREAAGEAMPVSLLPPVSLDAFLLEGDGEAFVERVAGTEPDPAEVVVSRDIWQFVAALPDAEERLIVWLYVGEGQTLKDVAERLGMSREGVRQAKERALWRLRKMLEEAGWQE